MGCKDEWSPVPLAVCEACSLVWGLVILGGCAYAVFWLDHSGWWFLLAMLLAGSWNCKNCRSPAQIEAMRGEDDD